MKTLLVVAYILTTATAELGLLGALSKDPNALRSTINAALSLIPNGRSVDADALVSALSPVAADTNAHRVKYDGVDVGMDMEQFGLRAVECLSEGKGAEGDFVSLIDCVYSGFPEENKVYAEEEAELVKRWLATLDKHLEPVGGFMKCMTDLNEMGFAEKLSSDEPQGEKATDEL